MGHTETLKKNKQGVYEIRWSVGRRSHRRSTGTKDLKQAERFVRLNGRADCPIVRCGEALHFYMTHHVENGSVVDKDRQRDIHSNLAAFFDQRPIVTLTASDCFMYCLKRKAGKIGARRAKSDGTLRRELNMLIAAFNYAVKAKRLLATDVPFVPLPAAPGPRDFWLNEEERAQLLEACDGYPGRGSMFIRIALATAARRRSIETLRWSQVDGQAGLIDFRPAGAGQTAKRKVAVPISSALAPHLVRHVDGYSPFVLGTDKPITKAMEAVCNRAYRATGNDRFLQVTPHVLRHTWATLAARAGVSMFEIAGVLGDNIQTVQRNYLHHSPEHLRAAVNFMEPK